MTYTAETPIKGLSRGDARHIGDWATTKGAARPDDVRNYLTTVYKLAPQLGINPDVVVAQSILETTDLGIPWNSIWWRSRCNPAGIGITGDARQNAVSRDFLTGGAAAMAHLLHLHLYVNGGMVPPGFLASDDPRWQDAIDADLAGTARVLHDLVNTWAMDPAYDLKIADHLNGMDAAGLFDSTLTPAPPAPETAPMATTKPYILVTAGHRSYGDGGSDVERQLTDDLAIADVAAFRAAGYTADWFQRDVDNDTDPTMTVGGLDAVALGCARVLAARKEPLCILIDDHYNGPSSPVHAIVPDVTGLHTAYTNGAPADDTAADNSADVDLAQRIAAGIVSANPGMSLFHGRLDVPGVMSEREAGVALNYAARLAMFGATAKVRSRVIRLVVEHGGTNDAQRSEFFTRCAAAKVSAVDAFIANRAAGGDSPAPTPIPIPPDVPVVTPPVAYPDGIDKTRAGILFGKVKGTDGVTYGFDETGPVSQQWIAEAARTGTFPPIVSATIQADGTRMFGFGNGLLIWKRPNGALTIYRPAEAHAA